MRYSIVLLSSIIVLSTASPAPKIIGNDDIAKRSPEEIKLKDGTVITVTDAKAKRSPEEIKLKDGTTITVTDDAKRKRSPHDVQLRDGSWLSVRDLAVAEKREASLSKREDDKISSCGPKSGWIPVEDHGSPAISPNGLQFWGFKSAVQEYCSRISYDFNGNPVIVASGKATSYTVRWKYDDPTMQDDQRDNRIGLKNEVPGHIEFEIHNKRGDNGAEYVVNEDDCNKFLANLWNETISGSCYGKDNKDTKGGTWQMEDNKLTFHALPAAESGTPSSGTPPHDETK